MNTDSEATDNEVDINDIEIKQRSKVLNVLRGWKFKN